VSRWKQPWIQLTSRMNTRISPLQTLNTFIILTAQADLAVCVSM
jgi:hypothetical protein